MNTILLILGQLLIFPGFLFLVLASLFITWIDRVLVARWQDRVGPPWYQPMADLLKLFGKEDVTPHGTLAFASALLPILAVAATLTASLFIPIGHWSPYAFEGDLILVIFLLSIPTLAYFLAGWVTPSIYSFIGGNRALLQYFSYEVPLLVALVAPAVYSQTWSITQLVDAQRGYHWHVLLLPVGFCISIIGFIGKLKRVPFDIPNAKSEIGEGPLTEYSGRKLALWKLSVSLQTWVGLTLLEAVYLGGADRIWGNWGILIFAIKILVLVAVLSLIQVLYARLRIDQMAIIGWRILVPLGILQILVAVWTGGS
ncbi:MAG: complex I subunit 1 family protein [Anaerolineae bacterium]